MQTGDRSISVIRISAVATVALLFLLTLTPATTFAAKKGLPILGTVQHFPVYGILDFCWWGTECGSTGITFNKDTTFYWDGNFGGYWSVDVPARTLYLDFTGGCLPLYTLVHDYDLHGSGGMECRDGSGMWGTAEIQITGH